MAKDYFPKSEQGMLIFFYNMIVQLTATLTDPDTVWGLSLVQRQALIDVCQEAIDQINTIATKKNELEEMVDTKNTAVKAADDLVRSSVKIIKADPGYTENIGDLLAIIAPKEIINPDEAKPIIKNVTVLPDVVKVKYLKGPFKGVLVERALGEIMDTGGGTEPQTLSQDDVAGLSLQWQPAGKDDNPPYEDKLPNVSQNPEVRYYRFRYYTGENNAIGIYSDIVRAVAEIYIR